MSNNCAFCYIARNKPWIQDNGLTRYHKNNNYSGTRSRIFRDSKVNTCAMRLIPRVYVPPSYALQQERKGCNLTRFSSLRWSHNGRDSVSNHCLLHRLFRRRSKKTSKLRVTGLCVGNSSGPVNSPHKRPVTRKMFPFDDVIMITGCNGSCR